MSWFWGSSPSPAQSYAESSGTQPTAPNNLASDLKQSAADSAQQKVKPCCVCKDEKTARDDCMLFSRADDPQEDCKGMVNKYKDCMKGFGFNVA